MSLAALLPLSKVPPSAFFDWTTGDRSSSIDQLQELADSVPLTALCKLRALCTDTGSSWSTLLHGNSLQAESLLALLLTLLERQDTAAVAASTLLATMTCNGAATNGMFHPFVLFQLTKTLRQLLLGEAKAQVIMGNACNRGRLSGTATDRSFQADGEAHEAHESTDTSGVPEPPGGLAALREPRAEVCELVDSAAAGSSSDGSRRRLLDDIRQLLTRVPLRSHPDTHMQLVHLLADVGAYGELGLCLGDAHGEPEHTLRAVMRAMMPTLLENGMGATTIGKQRECIRFLAAALEGQLMPGANDDGGRRADAAVLAVQALLQHVSVGAPERAEPRDKLCTGLARFLVNVPPIISSGYASFLWTYSRTAKQGARSFAVEMAGAALREAATSNMRAVGDSLPTGLHEDGTPQTLWRLLMQRLGDKTASVRAKAVSIVASVLTSLEDEVPGRELLRIAQKALPAAQLRADQGAPSSAALLSPNTTECGAADAVGRGAPTDVQGCMGTPTSASMGSFAPMSGNLCDSMGPLVSLSPSAVASPLVSLLEAASTMEVSLATLGQQLLSRCLDLKPNVRRAALAALESWAKVSNVHLSSAQLVSVSKRCQDTSPAVRKQAAKTLGELLKLDPRSQVLRSAWVDGVLPLLCDAEASVSEGAVDMLRETMLVPLDRCAASPARGFESAAWSLLQSVTAETESMLARGVYKLIQQRRLPSSLGKAALAMLEVASAEAATVPAHKAARSALWAVVMEISNHSGYMANASCILDGAALARCYEAAATRGSDGAGEASSALRTLTSLAKRGQLAESLASKVAANVEASVHEFAASAAVMAPLVQARTSMLRASATPTWAANLMTACETRLRGAKVANGNNFAATDAECAVALVAASELVIAMPHLKPPTLVATVQSIATAQVDTEPGSACARDDIGGKHADVESGTIMAMAFVALGKCCHGSSELTKRLLPVFVRELSSNPSAAVRNNAVVVLHDLTKVHTALVDRHLTALGLALGDACALVRQQALLLIAQLVLEDYVKWRPPLLRCFVTVLVDPEPSLRLAAHGTRRTGLTSRVPLLCEARPC